MALTKVTGQVIKNTTDVTVGVLTVTNTLAVGGTVSIGGTLTYEDVTNVDAVGLITARNGIVVGSGITLSKDGDIFATGVTTTGSLVSSGAISGTTGTFTGDVDVAAHIRHTGDTDTKISFDTDIIHFDTDNTERVRIDSSGRVLVGHTGSLSEGTGFQVVNTSDNTAEFFAYAASTSGARLTLTKSRSGTKGTNTVVQSGDKLGEIHFRGADGTGYIRGATISAEVDGTPGTNDMPGRLIFSTTADGANSHTERARITSAGLFGIGTNAPTSKLYVNGVSTADIITARAADSNGNSIINILSEGTTGNSRINFSDTAGTDGQVSYSHSDRAIIFAAAGTTEKVRINTEGITIKNAGAGGGIGINALGTTSEYGLITANANRSGENDILLGVGASWNGDSVAQIDFRAGLDTTNKDDGKIMFYTQTSSGGGLVERMRIDQNGKVIVATGQLHSTRVLAKFGIDCQGLDIYDDVADVSNYGMAFYNDPDTNKANGIGFFNDDGQSCGGYIVHQDRGGSNVGDIIMATSGSANTPVERFRIRNGGDVSTTGDTGFTRTTSGITARSGDSFSVARANGTPLEVCRTGNTGALVNWFSGSTAVASVSWNGSTMTYGGTSDYRLKENIIEMTGGIDAVKKLKPIKFNFIATPEKTVEGFIAHEVQEVIPQAVTGEKDCEVDEEGKGYQQLDPAQLVPTLTKALQEAIAEIETLKVKVAALEGS